jgi:hypothetical protein
MADRVLLDEIQEGAAAMALIAASDETFRALVDAFRARDGESMQMLLARHGLEERCELVCHWLRSKECVLLCLELSGPPLLEVEPPDVRKFADVVARVTAEDELVRQIVIAIEERDHDAWGALVKQHDLEKFSHLLCHWACTVRYRIVCDVVCRPDVKRPQLFSELQTAGHAIRRLAEDEESFAAAVEAVNTDDCEWLRATVEKAGLAPIGQWICEWFCSWRCMLLCLRLCRVFPVERPEPPLEEMIEFARAGGRLAAEQGALERLGAAVLRDEVETVHGLVEKLEFERYCIQFCHWVCFLRCERFCICVNPPLFNHPWFTHVGDFDILGDFDAAGLTNKAEGGHGGPGFGFSGNLSLRGLCPKFDPANPTQPMAYRFLFQQAGQAAATPITGGFVSDVLVGSRYTTWNGVANVLQSVRIRGIGATSPTPPPYDGSPAPPDHYIVPDAEGWVPVDPQALDEAFYGSLMGFSTPVAFPGGDPAPGIQAGEPVPKADQRNGVSAAIIFQATRVSTIGAVNGGGAPDYTNQLATIHINNWGEVGLLGLLQFAAGACTPLTNTLTIEYTTDHELLADWSIGLTTAASVPGPPTFPSGAGPRGSASSDVHSLQGWPSCSYLVTLTTRRRLTDGLNDDPSKTIGQTTFCID